MLPGPSSASAEVEARVETLRRDAPRVAIVHEWLSGFYGSERVAAQMLRCFPGAHVHTLVDFMDPADRAWLGDAVVKTSLIQHLPFARQRFRMWLPLMPLAIEQFDLSDYDLVLSSSHAFAKGVLTGPGQVHVSYVHAPMRWAWEYQHQYLREAGLDRGMRSWATRWLLHRLRRWDAVTGAYPDRMIANSRFIRERIRSRYRRDADVLHPPVALADLAGPAVAKGEHYVAVSRFVPYKRTELIVEAFAAMPDRRLIVIGDGPGRDRVRPTRNVELLGRQPRAELVRHLASARALVFAAEEDFGITLVEAQAAGTPVIAYGRGGALDIVDPAPGERPTGVFFAAQTIEAICDAVRRFEAEEAGFRRADLITSAARFDESLFRERYLRLVASAWAERSWPPRAGSASAR